MIQTWSTIKEVINSKKTLRVPSLFLPDGKVFNELDEITEGFNTYFENIGKYWHPLFQTPIHLLVIFL